MSDVTTFSELIRRIRAGDDAAAEELVRQYEPEIRREIRVRLTDPGLRRLVDSMDICQSVLGNFFARAALGQFELNEPRQLLRLLVTMARNRITDWARQQHAERRDQRREVSLDSEMVAGREPLAPDPSPSHVVAGRDLLQQVRARLSDDEQRIADQRAAGLEWRQIGAERGESAEALRKRLTRALDRIAGELGL